MGSDDARARPRGRTIRLGPLVSAAAAEVGAARGVRILHVTDVHNRAAGLRAATLLSRGLEVDLTIDTGDMSGLPAPARYLFIRTCFRPVHPYLFVPGNHDDERSRRQVARRGAVVMDGSACFEQCQVRVWGTPDPNRTRFGAGDRYSTALARKAAAQDPGSSPVIAAVHSELMVEPRPGITLVLCGHVHEPKVDRVADTLIMRPGSSGGGGPFGGELRFGVIDVEAETCVPIAAWLLALGRVARVDRVL